MHPHSWLAGGQDGSVLTPCRSINVNKLEKPQPKQLYPCPRYAAISLLQPPRSWDDRSMPGSDSSQRCPGWRGTCTPATTFRGAGRVSSTCHHARFQGASGRTRAACVAPACRSGVTSATTPAGQHGLRQRSPPQMCGCSSEEGTCMEGSRLHICPLAGWGSPGGHG